MEALWRLNSYLMVRDGDGPPEHYPLHNFTTRWGRQRTCVPVIAAQGCRQEVPEDERIQKGLFLCLGEEGKEKHSGYVLLGGRHTVKTLGMWVPRYKSCACLHPEKHKHLVVGTVENTAAFPRVCSETSHSTAFHEKTGSMVNNSGQHCNPSLSPGNRQNISTVESLSPAEKKQTWFCLPHSFPIFFQLS